MASDRSELIALLSRVPTLDGNLAQPAGSSPDRFVRSGQDFNPKTVLEGGVLTKTFANHQDRNPPSKAPGVDIDRPSPPIPIAKT